MFGYSVMALMMGTVILFLSIPPLHAICRKSGAKGWCFLRLLVVAFIAGYSSYLSYVVTAPAATFADVLVSSIMLGGSMFVILVSHYSHRSLNEITDLATLERHNALHDTLTALPNRQFFKQHLRICQQTQHPHFLCLIDLNGFKKINDSIGHFYGDMLLQQVAKRLTHISRSSSERFFRLGGDEFALLIRPEGTNTLEKAVERITEQFEKEFILDEYTVSIQCAIGVIGFCADAESADALLKNADLALYQNKCSANSYSLFDKKMQSEDDKRIALRSSLKHALSERELTVFYQPIVSAKSEKVIGLEALIRWPQKDGTYISPEIFIPLAEQDTTINVITQYALRQVAEDLKILKKQNMNLGIHVNLSVKDIQYTGLPERIKDFLDINAFSPRDVLFEITESAMMTDVEQASKTLQALSSMGFSFSIDDFGTGFSSLSFLKHLPIDQIKIDRAFVRELQNNSADMAIVESTLFLAKKLGCTVVAEGVETNAVATILQKLECDYLQGYLFAKPQSLNDFLTFYKRYNANLVGVKEALSP